MESFQFEVIAHSRAHILRELADRPELMAFQAGCFRDQLGEIAALAQGALDDGRFAVATMFLTVAARIHTALGDLAESERLFARAVEAAGRIPPAPYLVLQMSVVPIEQAMVRREGLMNFLAPAVATIERAEQENAWAMVACKSMVSALAAWSGQEAEAIRWLEGAIPAIESGPGWAANYPAMTSLAGQTLWTLGRRDHLEIIERNVREKVIAPDFRYINQDGRRTLAQLCSLTGRFDEARDWFQQARVVLEEEGSRPLRAIVDLEEAEAIVRFGAPGGRERALPLLEVARSQFGPLAMSGWLRRADELEAELAE